MPTSALDLNHSEKMWNDFKGYFENGGRSLKVPLFAHISSFWDRSNYWSKIEYGSLCALPVKTQPVFSRSERNTSSAEFGQPSWVPVVHPCRYLDYAISSIDFILKNQKTCSRTDFFTPTFDHHFSFISQNIMLTNKKMKISTLDFRVSLLNLNLTSRPNNPLTRLIIDQSI